MTSGASVIGLFALPRNGSTPTPARRCLSAGTSRRIRVLRARHGGFITIHGGDANTLLSLANVVLFVVPLMTLVYGTIYYNSREFVELLLAQPLKRRTVFAGLYLGLAVPLTVAFVAGVSIPFLLWVDLRFEPSSRQCLSADRRSR